MSRIPARAVVVGGGISGLAAAHRLTAAGTEVTVVEADHHLGGKLRTTPFAGRNVDEGADSFLLRVPWALDLATDLGLAPELVHPAARTAYVWSHGALRPLPPQLMGVPTDPDALAASGLVSDDAVARVRADMALADPPPGEVPDQPDETIAAMVERRLGREVLDRMVDPLVGGINAGDTRHLSLQAVVPQLAAAAHDPRHASLVQACRAQQAASTAAPTDPIFAGPAGGMGRLVDALAAALVTPAGGQSPATIRMGRRVDAIEPAGTGSTDGAGYSVLLDDGTRLDTDLLVLAVPAGVAADLLRPLIAAKADPLSTIAYASAAIVTLAFRPADVGHAMDRSGFLVPRVEATTALTACSWASTKWEHLGPDHGDGTAVLRASAGRAGDEHALDLDDDDLVAALLDDLALTMGITGAPTEARVSRWTRGLPQYEPGHLQLIAETHAALPTGIALAGAALNGVGVPACIHSGQQAADRLLSRSGA